jgi:catabolite regulation protein CreA
MARRLAALVIAGLAAWAAVAAARASVVAPDCTFHGFKLHGKIMAVDAFPDVKVQVVTAFPDLKVKTVQAFPTHCGEWQMVDAFPDTKVQFVTAFPDVKIQFVQSFPGLP